MKAELKDNISAISARSLIEWRAWLRKNGNKEKSVWLIIYTKASNLPSITYREAVDEALCFGWIDSKGNKRNEKSYYQYFAKRNPRSKWSKVNKERINHLIEEGRMQKEGLEAIALAKQNGTWNALDEVDNHIIPEDLQKALKENKKALEHFTAFPKSSKKIILEWISNAKRTETRLKRIQETIELAAKNIRANHYRH